jgi:HTH-type transcriptional regulator/antitoxin HigA
MAGERRPWRPGWSVPPGEILSEALEERRISQTELARRMGRPVKTINEIVNGKAAITPETAIQLELALGISASFWNGLESTHRERLAYERTAAELATHRDWAKAFPLLEMRRHGLLAEGESDAEVVASVLKFFGVSSPAAWENRWTTPQAAYRKSAAFVSSPHAVATWLRWGEVLAAQLDPAEFDPERFRDELVRAREESRREPFSAVVDRLRARFADCGVVLALVPELPGARTSGAARWTPHGAGILQLSLRYKTDDQFWFSLFHEAAHLLGKERTEIVDSDEGSNASTAEEQRADRVARNLLIDPAAYASFSERSIDVDTVRTFAREQGISPGIVVGRLQHDGRLPRNRLNHLKRKLTWA